MALAKRSHLRRAAQRGAVGQRVAQPHVVTLTAPVGGLNARDSLSEMDAKDAVRLDNWYPEYGKVTVRRGFTEYAAITGATGAVETLMELKLAAGTQLIAACDGGLWNVTAGGAIASAIGGSSPFSNDRWQWVAMNDVLGLVNGANAPQTYDGSSKTAMTVSGSGLTVADLSWVNVFKARSYFGTGADQSFWYSAVNTLGGSLTEFPLGDVGTFGGSLMFMATWTRDGGDGMDDLAVFVMTSGEVIVYQGSDPGEATDWSLVGVFRIGSPMGVRSYAKVGGDLLIATVDGYTLLSKAIGEPRGTRGTNISDKILNAALEVTRDTVGDFGWQVFHYPRGRQLWVNHPAGGGVFEQHVANLGTGAWCRYRQQPARCLCLFDDAPMFGGAAGKVYQADEGLTDDGADVVANARQAFNYLGTRATAKQVQMVRPLLEASSDVPLTLGLAVDFDPTVAAEVTATLGVEAEGALWDVAEWDVAMWGSVPVVVQAWFAHSARGYAISPQLTVSQSDARISWNATSLSFQRAGII